MLRPALPIETSRLVMRLFTPDDLTALHSFYSRPDVARFLYWEPRDLVQVRTVLTDKAATAELTDEGQALCLAVTLRETGELIGEALLFWRSREHLQGEVGYVFHPDHHGKGYATEATREMLRLGFEGLGLHRIVARCDGRNTASTKVMERLGMRKEAHLVENEMVKGEWTDEIVYAVLRREWR
ncbi:GNAT family N-acetyltransferase [Herbidospora sp. NEAU-GS84]|uniref:GNAT family N-acetyltransferase n=1 Tax=Herbidospora solisilvae TaxID=2696284 RepID=A0A7C9J2X3_9ACTN|nr:GNAT family N-acetyltransferase [Herbidospora solisilvae]NAS22805.1 GNAT family N-acetyltransferase [Herbidospora solisilvae]